MSAVLATCRREIRAFFVSPLAWVVLTFFLVVNGFIFWLIVSFLNDPRSQLGAPMELFFGQTVFFWIVLLFLAPILTMRAIAEERRSGTIEVLLTSPITEGQVVAGKFLGALASYTFLWAPTVIYAVLIYHYAHLDWGPVAAGYLGVLGIGCLFLSVGLFASTVSRSQLVAALVSFAILVPLFCAGLLQSLVNAPHLKDALGYLDLWQQMSDFGKGIVDTRALVYYFTATLLFLFLAARALETRKWR